MVELERLSDDDLIEKYKNANDKINALNATQLALKVVANGG